MDLDDMWWTAVILIWVGLVHVDDHDPHHVRLGWAALGIAAVILVVGALAHRRGDS